MLVDMEGIMTREFVRLLEFEKQCKGIGLIEENIKEIENAIMAHPAIGDVIQGTGGLRKFRMPLDNVGKSGGIRVIYIDFIKFEKIYLITTYAKSDLESLTKAECNELKALVKVLESELRKKAKK
jgi:hypothetical protein